MVDPPGAVTVELLDQAVDAEPPSDRHRTAHQSDVSNQSGISNQGTISNRNNGPSGAAGRYALALVAALGVGAGLRLLSTAEPPSSGELTWATTRFGDPFNRHWIPLRPQPNSASDRLPMASSGDPSCVGFGRPDWPEETRRPTVARCVEPSGGSIAREGITVVHTSVAGAQTWYFLTFGGDVDQIDVDVTDQLGQRTEAEIYVGGRHLALAIPTDHRLVSLLWRVDGAQRYRCSIIAGDAIMASGAAGPSPPGCSD